MPDNLLQSNSKSPKLMANGHTTSGRHGSNLDAQAAVKDPKPLLGRLGVKG